MGVLEEMIGSKVVIDLRSEYVCLGTLLGVDEHFLQLRNADLHDLRDTDTTREIYVAESRATGIKRNRKRLVLVRSEIVGIARLEDVVDE
jgi:small nuclear ribonucleoprotein (snRNP)-like protein